MSSNLPNYGNGSTFLNQVPSKKVVVKDASDIPLSPDSTVEYLIDGVVDLGTRQIEVPPTGLYLGGHNFDVSKLISSEPNYTMFVSPVGGSGNVIGKDYAIETTGSSSKVYNLVGNTGFEAFEFSRINYNNCSSLGEITNYRQGFESGTGRFGGKPELTLSGTWVGGYFIDASIVRGLADGSYSLFKAGAGFSMNSRFRSNMNIDLPTNASYFDFAPSHFVNPSTVQIENGIVTRNGVFDSSDANYTPNMSASDLSASWTNNNGMPNTFEGGSVGVTIPDVTNISVVGDFVEITAAQWESSDLQHFDNPTGGRIRNLGNAPREYKVIASFSLSSSANNEITLRVSKWDNSAGTSSVILKQTRQVNNLVGGRDVAFFDININTTLDRDDYVYLEASNNTATNNITAEIDSYMVIEAR